MKRLLLLRHAKSDWGADYGGDHERPLNPRGREAAARVGRALAALGQVPQAVLTSSAVRARETVERAAEAGGWSCPVEVSRDLYLSSTEDVLAAVRWQDDAVERLLVAGHEPVWSALVGELVGGARVKFPTAALARLDLGVGRWADVRPGAGTLAWLLTPKVLAKLGFGG